VRLTKLAWLAVFFLWLGGCAAVPPVKPPAALMAPDEIVSQLRSRQERVQSFQGKGRLTFLSPQRNYSGTALLKGLEPTTLRVDILDFLGRSLLSFSSNGREVQVLSPKEGKFYYGQATPANLAALIPPAVTLPQVLHLLVGGLPLSAGPPDRWQYDPAQETYLLEWHQTDGSLKERLWVKATDLHPAKEEFYGNAGQLLFTVDLGDYGSLAPDLPGQIILRTNAPKVELRLAYRELLLNPALAAADLELKAPPAMAVVPLGK
jgi:outer membrane biogenesis lipoprotein LolB